MEFTNQLPTSFPGFELAQKEVSDLSDTYIYEIGWLTVGHTTTGKEIVMPDIEYRALAVITKRLVDSMDARYIDSGATNAPESLLTDGQRTALETAKGLRRMREEEDPSLITFASLRKVQRDGNGLLFVGSGGWDFEPFAAVQDIESLTIVDFATQVHGYYGIFRYVESDMQYFVPEEFRDVANAYGFIDEPRIVSENGNPEFQVAKIRLYKVNADLNTSPEDYTQPKITFVDEDGNEILPKSDQEEV